MVNFGPFKGGFGRKNADGPFFMGDDRGLATLIIGIAAVVFSLGTLLSDLIRDRNLLIHDLQVDGQIFHHTLVRLDRIRCLSMEIQKDVAKEQCEDTQFFDPNPNSRGREILLQRAEFLERRIEALLNKLDMEEFGYITPVDYRTLAKEELRDLNFEKAENFIHKEVVALSSYRGHPGYVLRSIHADLVQGWYHEILLGKKRGVTRESPFFASAIAKAESQISILPVRNYMVVFILQQEGCAQWIGQSLFYARTLEKPSITSFEKARTILANEPLTVKILKTLRTNDKAFASGDREVILSTCTKMFDKI